MEFSRFLKEEFRCAFMFYNFLYENENFLRRFYLDFKGWRGKEKSVLLSYFLLSSNTGGNIAGAEAAVGRLGVLVGLVVLAVLVVPVGLVDGILAGRVVVVESEVCVAHHNRPCPFSTVPSLLHKLVRIQIF